MLITLCIFVPRTIFKTSKNKTLILYIMKVVYGKKTCYMVKWAKKYDWLHKNFYSIFFCVLWISFQNEIFLKKFVHEISIFNFLIAILLFYIL